MLDAGESASAVAADEHAVCLHMVIDQEHKAALSNGVDRISQFNGLR